jgi:hypothetical protein
VPAIQRRFAVKALRGKLLTLPPTFSPLFFWLKAFILQHVEFQPLRSTRPPNGWHKW